MENEQMSQCNTYKQRQKQQIQTTKKTSNKQQMYSNYNLLFDDVDKEQFEVFKAPVYAGSSALLQQWLVALWCGGVMWCGVVV